MACDEDRPASQCGSAARWSRSITSSSSSCSCIFVLLGTRFALCPRLSVFWFRSFALALVVAAFQQLLYSACTLLWFGFGPWGCDCFSSASVFPSGSRLRHVTSCILFDFPFSLDVELIWTSTEPLAGIHLEPPLFLFLPPF